jgi:hypothetical protein
MAKLTSICIRDAENGHPNFRMPKGKSEVELLLHVDEFRKPLGLGV